MLRYRNDGMMFAFQIAKKDGVEALEKEIKNRNACFIPMEFTRDEVIAVNQMLSARILQTYQTVMYFSIHEMFGFGKNRLERLQRYFDEQCEILDDWDAWGERYVTIKDMAEELNEKYGLNLNTDVVLEVEEAHENNRVKGHFVKVSEVIDVLEHNGFREAAELFRQEERKRFG